MAKFFMDFEFIEGFHKPLFGKRRHFIDMISVGIVCDDGREYYAISTEFNPKKANKWVKDNVISKLPARYVDFYDSPRARQESLLWKSNKRIVSDLLNFFSCEYEDGNWCAPEGIEVFGYYADYDWVLLCSLFGRMIDLPTGMPMFCIDLKQTLDEKVENMIFSKRQKFNILSDTTVPNMPLAVKLGRVKAHPDYPKQAKEHHALADAKWNYELYKFLQTI